MRIVDLTDSEALETQIVENLLRADLHPFEEAQGFRALLESEGAAYTVARMAAKTGKAASFIAERLRLLDLAPPVAEAFTAGRIGVEHALLIAKVPSDVQEKALAHCFDGYYAANDQERSLVPVSRLRVWLEQNIYRRLKSVPFSKDDERSCRKRGVARTAPSGRASTRCSSPKCGKIPVRLRTQRPRPKRKPYQSSPAAAKRERGRPLPDGSFYFRLSQSAGGAAAA